MIGSDVVIPDRLPLMVRLLGGRDKSDRGSFRMKWGSLSLGVRGCALEICLFEEGFSFQINLLWIQCFIDLPFLNKYRHDPEDMMESWGASLREGCWHLHWGKRTKLWTLPWHDWMQTNHEVRRADGSWSKYVGTWENDMALARARDGSTPILKEPDGRHIEVYPYRYLLNSGQFQERTASIFVERRTRKLRRLRRLPWGITTYAIEVTFNDEVGERTGSWKGGTLGCGYTLRPNETPRECLKRMERERKF